MANIIDGYGSQFFGDQEVLSPDLNNMQYSSIQHFRTYLQQATTTFGVLISSRGNNNSLNTTGLHVSSNNDGTLLSIVPGMAIDSMGRLIYVPKNPTVVSGSLGADPLYYPARPNIDLFDPGIAGAGTYYVNLYYVPLYGSQEPDDSGGQHFTRVYDSYRIAVETSIAVAPGISLARGVFNASGSLEQTNESGGHTAGNGTPYALFDVRTGYVGADSQQGTHEADIQALNTAVFSEELEKSVGFVFPADGHSIVTKIHRNATIIRMELYMEVQSGETGTVEFSFYSGSVANSWRTGPLTLGTSTPDLFTLGATLNMPYGANNPIKFELTRADDSVTRVTATIVYKRR